MQKRFHVSFHPTFKEALDAKHEKKRNDPDGSYQIRRRANNFEVVVRIAENVQKAHPENIIKSKNRRG